MSDHDKWNGAGSHLGFLIDKLSALRAEDSRLDLIESALTCTDDKRLSLATRILTGEGDSYSVAEDAICLLFPGTSVLELQAIWKIIEGDGWAVVTGFADDERVRIASAVLGGESCETCKFDCYINGERACFLFGSYRRLCVMWTEREQGGERSGI